MKKSRPYVVCHMVTTVDGRIQPHNWPMKNAHSQYEKCHRLLKGDAWIVGRTTMEGFSSGKIKRLPKADRSFGKTDFVAEHSAKKFAIVIDQAGKCRWESNLIEGDHILEILTEKVSLDYLAHLREKKVSYIFAGKTAIHLELALVKLRELFGIRRLMLEGGGVVNGSFLNAGLIDELSQLFMPLADGSIGTPTLFDVEEGHTKRRPVQLKLKSVKRFAQDLLWFRYSVG